MRLLDRYLLRELIVPLAYCLGGFLVFWVSFDLFSEMDDFLGRRLTFRDVVEYYLVMVPEFMVTVTPVALLLALLYALTNHARYHELTAMRAAGLGMWRISIPYVAVGLVLSASLFALNELWVPKASAAAEEIMTRRQVRPVDTLGPEWHRNLNFRNERHRRIWNIGAFNLDSGEMLRVFLEWPAEDGSRRRLWAMQARYTEGVWVFYQVKELIYPNHPQADPRRATIEILALPELTETPRQVRSEIRFSQLSNVKASKRPVLSLSEIRDYQSLHPYLGESDRWKLETQFHGRLAEPWTALVVVLIAIPFGAPTGRRNVFVGVASSIFIVFSYFIIDRLGGVLGTAGYVPPWAAAWVPNLGFATAGLWLTLRVR